MGHNFRSTTALAQGLTVLGYLMGLKFTFNKFTNKLLLPLAQGLTVFNGIRLHFTLNEFINKLYLPLTQGLTVFSLMGFHFYF